MITFRTSTFACRSMSPGGIQFDLLFQGSKDPVDRLVEQTLREAGGPLTVAQLSLRLEVRVDGQTYRPDPHVLRKALRRLALSGHVRNRSNEKRWSLA